MSDAYVPASVVRHAQWYFSHTHALPLPQACASGDPAFWRALLQCSKSLSVACDWLGLAVLFLAGCPEPGLGPTWVPFLFLSFMTMLDEIHEMPWGSRSVVLKQCPGRVSMGSVSGAVVLFSAAKAVESLDLVRLWVLQGLLNGHVTYTVTRALHFEGPHPWLNALLVLSKNS